MSCGIFTDAQFKIRVMNFSETIFLVGMMGSGKTTIGRQLARTLGRRFIDCDQELERRTGVSIRVIFDIEGEAGFRKRERQLILELADEPGLVIATGGGAVLAAENRACMTRRGLVIYLAVPLNSLWERVRNDGRRPLLDVDDPRKRIEELYASRAPLYQEVADIVVEGAHCRESTVLAMIEKELKRRSAANG